LRLFKSKELNQQHKQTVLFVCVKNAGRSQMAEAFFKKHALDGYDAISAGTRPVSMVNPIAIEVMKEVGIDISNHRPKILTEDIVKFLIGSNANLGANAPNYSFPIPVVFGIEVLASALLMAVILVVVHTKGLRGFSGIAIGGIVGLDIFFLAFISGASMNPARSLAPAIFSGVFINLWLYFSATFVGTSTVALILRRKFEDK